MNLGHFNQQANALTIRPLLYTHVTQHVWFLKIAFVRTSVYACVCMCISVCPPLRLIITSGMIWPPYDWLNKFKSFYVAAVVSIVSRCGL